MIYLILNSILSLIGIYISYKIFVGKRNPKNFICKIGNKVDCQHVLTSKFSKLFGIDIEKIGVVYYSTIFLVYLSTILISKWFLDIGSNFMIIDKLNFFAIILSFSGFAFSIYLLYIQGFYIKNWCAWCVSSAVVSIAIFFLGMASIYHNNIELSLILKNNLSSVIIIQVFAIAIGTGAATLSALMTINFLKDFKIDRNEDSKINLVNQIIWFALLLMLGTHLCLYIMNPDMFLLDEFLTSQFIVLMMTLINNAILTLHVGPRLIETRIDLSSINVFKTFWLRQIAFAMGTISIISWYVIVLFSFFETKLNSDAIIMVSYYLALLIIGVVLSQFAIFLIDKIRANSLAKK